MGYVQSIVGYFGVQWPILVRNLALQVVTTLELPTRGGVLRTSWLEAIPSPQRPHKPLLLLRSLSNGSFMYPKTPKTCLNPRAPSMLPMPTLGAKVYEWELRWAIWSSMVKLDTQAHLHSVRRRHGGEHALQRVPQGAVVGLESPLEGTAGASILPMVWSYILNVARISAHIHISIKLVIIQVLILLGGPGYV